MLLQVPLEADVELGKQALQESQFGRQTVYHPHWTPLIQSVGWDLVSALENDSSSSYYQWDFGVLEDSNTVNAFALPGGVVRVTSALLEQLKLTEGELAALLGHEMGHVLHRHSQARILQQQIIGTILQAIVYKDDDPHEESFGEAIGELLLQSADWLGRQSFSRSNEYQADAKSWELLTQSRRYNPQALKSLLEKLWDFHGRQGGKTSWESTHPGTLDRIGALEEKWNALSYPEQRKLLTRNTIL
jgi:predicted Zn-dependent protease